MHIRSFFYRLRSSRNFTHELHVVLEQCNPNASLDQKLSWLVDLFAWVRYQSPLLDEKENEPIKIAHARLRFLFSVLHRNPVWKQRVSSLLRSILVETRDIELFARSGLPEELSFWSELLDRIVRKFIPAKPLTEGGVQLVEALFPDERDLEWFSKLPAELRFEILALVRFELSSTESFAPVVEDIKDALLILVSEVRAIGMHYEIRKRIHGRVTESPFFDLTFLLRKLLENGFQKPGEANILSLEGLALTIKRCREEFAKVQAHLNEQGVSVRIVYLLELGLAKLKRIEDLIALLFGQADDGTTIFVFLSELIEQTQARAGIRSFLSQNGRLISKKIIERNANTGEHYIARNRNEFRAIFLRACGGGAVMSLTVLMKVFLGYWHLPDFFKGIVYSLNYSVSFVYIQIKGFTLATKQPAMTGPALANRIDQVRKRESVEVLLNEIIKIFRSQTVGILGNVGLVVPLIVLMDIVSRYVWKQTIIAEETKAYEMMTNAHLLSGAPLFAAWTGVLLWGSSVLGGLTDNWIHFVNLPDRIRNHRRSKYVFGQNLVDKAASFVERQGANVVSNVSLAFSLGLLPLIFNFFGIHLDVRHVTLSAGNMALGAMHFGPTVLYNIDFWWSLIGIFVVGFLNVLVSFSLAFWIALRSKKLLSAKRNEIYKAIFKRFKSSPLRFFFPPRDSIIEEEKI